MTRLKYTLDLSNLNNISEETAYWLGFIAADGCVFDYKNGAGCGFSIALKYEDSEHLEKLKSFLGSNHILYHNKKLNSTTLTIKRRDLFNVLYKYEIFPNKSLELKIPSYIIDTIYEKHWIRGYIDGDGSLATTSPREGYVALMVGVVGTEEVLLWIRKHMNSSANPRRKTSDGQPQITLQGNHKVIRFLDWLYADANIYLDRKYKKYQTMKEIYRSSYEKGSLNS